MVSDFRKISIVHRLAVLVVVSWTVAAPSAQQPPSAIASPASQVARGWAALAAGTPAAAVRIADELLTTNPRDHRALTLKVEALATTDPLRGLDAYERWLSLVRFEDLFLLEPIARGTLEQIVSGGDTGLKIEALERLVRTGAPGARERLRAVRTEANSVAVDAALLRAGDPDAAVRLTEQASNAAGGRAERIAEVLVAAGQPAIPALRRLLTDPAGPTRAAALRSLGRLDARAALTDIRDRLTDLDPLVRAWAAVALARMGDRQGEDRVSEMLGSPVADLRLLAAEAYADKGNGPWVSTILPLLKDPAGLTRLRAAELLAPVEPEAARLVLTEAAGDANPVVRAEATRIFEEPAVSLLTPSDWPTLRRWLRDKDAVVRLHTAGALIDLASGGR